MSDNTRDLAKFGYRELAMAADLLNAITTEGLPDGFDDEGVTVEFNPNSGNVFLVNEEFQTAMMNGEDLEHFYSCGECGAEGFKSDFDDETATEDPHTFDDEGNITHVDEA